jgi:hypothetical protein
LEHGIDGDSKEKKRHIIQKLNEMKLSNTIALSFTGIQKKDSDDRFSDAG